MGDVGITVTAVIGVVAAVIAIARWCTHQLIDELEGRDIDER